MCVCLGKGGVHVCYLHVVTLVTHNIMTYAVVAKANNSFCGHVEYSAVLESSFLCLRG